MSTPARESRHFAGPAGGSRPGGTMEPLFSTSPPPETTPPPDTRARPVRRLRHSPASKKREWPVCLPPTRASGTPTSEKPPRRGGGARGAPAPAGDDPRGEERRPRAGIPRAACPPRPRLLGHFGTSATEDAVPATASRSALFQEAGGNEQVGGAIRAASTARRTRARPRPKCRFCRARRCNRRAPPRPCPGPVHALNSLLRRSMMKVSRAGSRGRSTGGRMDLAKEGRNLHP